MPVKVRLQLEKLDNIIYKFLFNLASDVVGRVQKKMQEKKTGKKYKVPGTKRYYRASAKGEAPAIRTGKLFQSVTHTTPEKKGTKFTVIIGAANVDYAKYLEFKKDRPAFLPALREALQELEKK